MNKTTAKILKSIIAPFMLASQFLLPMGASCEPMKRREIIIDYNSQTFRAPRMELFSIGSDYPGTLARKDSMEQLSIVQKEIGFDTIRFHAIFHDDFGTFKLIDGKPNYDFTKIDQLYDDLLARGLKPFVELGFTPHDMRTSEQTIFYWKGNTSHPKDELWIGLIDAFVRHLIQRYGQDEVEKWYFEVWNEPNLDGFWERADKAAYFHLYDITYKAIKNISPKIKVGGPSTAGAAWVPEFIENGIKNNTKPDFITTHTYGVESGFLDEYGVSDQKLSQSSSAIIQDVINVRRQIDESPLKGRELFFTEWSTSYNPRDTVHDSYLSAPYILEKLRALDGIVQGMSYWTYSDLFEEPGPPTAEFQGGFGLLTPNGIRKPAYFAYKYLNKLGNNRQKTTDKQSFIAREGNSVRILTWDYTYPDTLKSNRDYFTKDQPSKHAQTVNLRLRNFPKGIYEIIENRTGYEQNDAQTAFIKIGSPNRLSKEQLEFLNSKAADIPVISQIKISARGRANISFDLRQNDVLFLEIRPHR